MSLKLLTLNIEGDVHLDRVTELLRLEQPDVVCLQEVFEADLPILEQAAGCRLYFFPMVNITRPHTHQPEPRGLWGVAWGTRLKHQRPESLYYGGPAPIPENYDHPTEVSRVLAWGKLEDPSNQTWLRVATTHFTWSAQGQTTQLQIEDFGVLAQQFDALEDLILCGDLNSPRGGQSWANFAGRFTDNVPAQITTTLDERYHYAGKLDLVVDGLFSTPEYRVSRVKVVSGVSDHMALVGFIERV